MTRRDSSWLLWHAIDHINPPTRPPQFTEEHAIASAVAWASRTDADLRATRARYLRQYANPDHRTHPDLGPRLRYRLALVRYVIRVRVSSRRIKKATKGERRGRAAR